MALFERTRPADWPTEMAESDPTHASEKSRLRLLVVQALVLSLFLPLFARLWYLQVLTGEGDQA